MNWGVSDLTLTDETVSLVDPVDFGDDPRSWLRRPESLLADNSTTTRSAHTIGGNRPERMHLK